MRHLVVVIDGARHRVQHTDDLGSDPIATLQARRAAGGVSMLVLESGETLPLDWARIDSLHVEPDDSPHAPPFEQFGDLAV